MGTRTLASEVKDQQPGLNSSPAEEMNNYSTSTKEMDDVQDSTNPQAHKGVPLPYGVHRIEIMTLPSLQLASYSNQLSFFFPSDCLHACISSAPKNPCRAPTHLNWPLKFPKGSSKRHDTLHVVTW
jgi:hypothetical protein